MESTPSDNSFMNKESINEAIKHSAQLFLDASDTKTRKESEISQASDRKDSLFSDDDNSHEYEKADFYNNNYWRQEIPELDFEIS